MVVVVPSKNGKAKEDKTKKKRPQEEKRERFDFYRRVVAMDAGGLALRARQVGTLWLAGFKEACCLHRVVLFCRMSRFLAIRTGQCFLLNGLIFLGSLFVLNSLVVPTLLWILPDRCEEAGSGVMCDHDSVLRMYSFLRGCLMGFFDIFWFYPLYVFSFILSSMWYNDIAKSAFAALGTRSSAKMESHGKIELSNTQEVDRLERPPGFEGVILGIGEQVYSILLLSFFFIEVLATGYIPFIGKAVNFLLLSWMYSYYCFEYKWNYLELSLDKRIKFFESNWPFFSGFGSPCVLAIFFFSPLVSYGVMAVLYPLFVLTAIGTHVEEVISLQRRSWSGMGPGKLPIFFAADAMSMKVLQLLPKDLHKDKRPSKMFLQS